MRIPILELDRVFHVGTLDPSQVGRNSGARSLEGKCLSVSLCPNAWQKIASLGGYDTHLLTTVDACFLDVLAALKDDGLREAIAEWGKAEGLVEETTIWRTWAYDDEVEEWRYITSATREAAEFEHDGGDDAPEGHEAVEPVQALGGTARLTAMTGVRFSPAEDAIDALVMAWAMAAPHGLHFDGVWWNEVFEPEILSAPRGAIFPERVSDWTAKPVTIYEIEDDAEIETMPDTVYATAGSAPSP